MLFPSKYVYVSLECMCFEILCYCLNIPLCIMCHQISRDDAIYFLYIELQRCNKNDEIWRCYRSNYILIDSLFLSILCEALNCLDVDFFISLRHLWGLHLRLLLSHTSNKKCDVFTCNKRTCLDVKRRSFLQKKPNC